MTEQKIETRRPVTFYVANWYGWAIAWMFILYGGVKIILGMLDRNYQDVGPLVIFLLIGILMFLVVSEFRRLKEWGWYGLVVMNGLIIILALFGLKQTLNVVLLVLSIVALGALFAPPTKALIFRRS